MLRKKELLASGKIQLIGLAKVQKRLGKRWKGLSKIVFGIVEDVIQHHLSNPSDFFVKYKDSNYLLFFASSNAAESKAIIASITRDIQQRLFELDDDALRDLEIRQTINSQHAAPPHDFDDFLDAFGSADTASPMEMVLPDAGEDDLLEKPDVACVDVEAEDYISENSIALDEIPLPPVDISYRPIWDVKRNALNTFLCMASPEGSSEQCLQVHSRLYEQLSPQQQAALDFQLLRITIAQVAKVVESGKKMLVGCPLQHQSLHNYAFYIQFRELLQKIPQEHRGYFIFYIMDVDKTLPVKDAYWFVMNLKHYARFVFAEVPLRHDINFTYLRKRHVDAVGFRLDQIISRKLSTDRMMNLFQLRASAMKIPMTFVFGITVVDSVASTAVVKYDYVCGDIIRKPVPEPDKVEPFRNDDLLLKMVKAEKA